jgi:hypothetical protein
MTGTSRPAQALRIIGYMILMATLTWWIAALAMPVAVEWELAETTVKRLPVYGFFIGAVLGLAMGYSASFKQPILFLIALVAFGSSLWILSLVFVGGTLIFIGVPQDTVDGMMDWIGPAAFSIGVLLGSVVALAFIHDRLGALRARVRTWRNKTS